MEPFEKIKMLIDYNKYENDISFETNYHEIFSDEGKRKAEYIINTLKTNSELKNENLDKYIYVSIGGGDGSEAEEILRTTDIKISYLIEIGDDACLKARERQKIISNSFDKKLIVIQGDATQRLDDLIKGIEYHKTELGLTGLILSMQAVIHELPKRSPKFRTPIFFGRIFSIFDKNLFFSREPMKAERWPQMVEVKIDQIPAKTLSTFASIINDKLSITETDITPVANGYVNINSTLALEMLHKLLRTKSVFHFKYELGEQLTSIDPDILKKSLESHLGPATVKLEPTVTDGFIEAWKSYKVQVKDEDGNNLGFPNTHIRIIGISIKKNTLPERDSKQNLKIKSEKVDFIPNRGDIRNQYPHIIEGVKIRFYVYGIGLGGWIYEYKELIQEKIRNNCEVKILALNPREEIFKIYFNQKNFSLVAWKDFESSNGKKYQEDSKYLQDWVFEENLKLIEENIENLIELKFYSSLPVGAIMIADSTVFYSPSLLHNSDDNTTMVFKKNDKPSIKYIEYFQKLWSDPYLTKQATSNHILFHTQKHGCVINSIRKRRKYKSDPLKIKTEWTSFVDHAKNKLLYHELSPLFLQAASRNTDIEVQFIRSIEKIRGEAIQYIVDLGCGVGRHSSILSNDYTVTGIDISEDEISLAKLSSNADFKVGDMRDWNTENKADLIICMWSTFNYLSTQADLDMFIDSCKRNIDKSGMVLLDLKNPSKISCAEYTRVSYTYPYEIKMKIKKELIEGNILHAIYNYDIKNIRTNHSVWATDQEINRKYDLEDIEKAFSRDFVISSVFGDYSANVPYTKDSDRMIVLLKYK